MDLSRVPRTDDSSQPPPRATVGRNVTDRDTVHDRWAALLIVAVAVWVVMPRLLQTLAAPKYLKSVGAETPSLSGVSSLASSVLGLALFGLCLFIVIDIAKDPHPGRFGRLAVMLAPWIYLTMRDLFVGIEPNRASIVYPMVVWTMWLLRPRIEVLRYLGYVVGAAAALSIALALVLPSKGLLYTAAGAELSEDKAIIGTGILVGFMTHGNNLGQFLALGLPFIGLVPQRRLRWLLFAITGFALVWTAARSILGAVVVGLVAVLIVAAMDRVARRRLAPVVVLIPFVVGGILPFLITNPTTFTNRGLIWVTSIDAWQRSPFTGLGSDWYARVGNTSGRLAGSVFNGHNQLIHLLVTGGVLLAVLVVLQLLMAADRSGEIAASGSLVAVAYVGTLAGAFVLEKALAIVDNAPMLPMTVLPLTVLICGTLARAPGDARARPNLRPGEQHASP